jgi:dUTP pyrophosphatase
MPKVKIKKLTPTAKIPTQETDGAVCYDMYADKISIDKRKKLIVIKTGIAMEIPKGYHIKLYARSSTFFKYGMLLGNSVGIIDSDYRGEIIAMFTYTNELELWSTLSAQQRLFQIQLRKNIKMEFDIVEELGYTERNDGGFGSTGE